MSGHVHNFYNGAKVFITGGTGFLGKLLTEKLLRKTEVAQIYLLVRQKKTKSADERAMDILNNEVFSILKRENPNALKKIHFINGDIIENNLGISQTDKQILIDNVNIIFHGAATVNFNENLLDAIEINVNGTEKMLHLAEEIKHLKAFMHISTAFSNCNQKEIKEQVYELENHLNLKALGQSIDKTLADKITPILLDKFPNTYVYSKRAAELLVMAKKHLPVGIFRPGIVTGCRNEPLPGYIDNIYGPTGAMLACMTGFCHVALMKGNTYAELVPADMVVNGIIVSTVSTAEDYSKKKEMPVYNFISSPVSPLTYGEFQNSVHKLTTKIPIETRIWHPFTIRTSSWLLYNLLFFFLHIIPGFCVDQLSKVTTKGKKFQFIKNYKKLNVSTTILIPFSTNNWLFEFQKIPKLWNSLSETEKNDFDFNLEKINWLQYIEIYMKGAKQFILRENNTTEFIAKKKCDRLMYIHYLLVGIISVMFIAILIPFTKNLALTN